MLVTGVTGPSQAHIGDEITYQVVSYDTPDPSEDEIKMVNWRVFSDGVIIFQLEKHGPIFKYKIPLSLSGCYIRVLPYLIAPSNRVSVRTDIFESLNSPIGSPTSFTEPAKLEDINFAPVTDIDYYWPIITHNNHHREVAYVDVNNNIHGKPSRYFLANRSGGKRYHVGIDLWGDEGDIVVACESGIVVYKSLNFYKGTGALYVQCDSSLVINYGEVEKYSWKDFDIDINSYVNAGQPIARIGKSDSGSIMCHFETYTVGTIHNERWYKNDPPPKNLLNPTKYLLHLALKGK